MAEKVTRNVYRNGVLVERTTKRPSDYKRLASFLKMVGDNIYLAAKPLPKPAK